MYENDVLLPFVCLSMILLGLYDVITPEIGPKYEVAIL